MNTKINAKNITVKLKLGKLISFKFRKAGPCPNIYIQHIDARSHFPNRRREEPK